MGECVQLTFAALGGNVFELPAAPSECMADVKKRLAINMAVPLGVQLKFLCGDRPVLDDELVASLPVYDLQVLSIFSASLCEVTVDGEFPADPKDFLPAESVATWPNLHHCFDSKLDKLRDLLNLKTKVQVSSTNANLVDIGLQPDPSLPIAAVMRHAERIECARLDWGPDFTQAPFNNGIGEPTQFQTLTQLGVISEDEAQLFQKEAYHIDETTEWRWQGERDSALTEYMLASMLLRTAHGKQGSTGQAIEIESDSDSEYNFNASSCEGPYVQRHVNEEARARVQPQSQDFYEPGLYTRQKFKIFFGDRYLDEWNAAGAAGINDDERAAIAGSQAALDQVLSKLKDPAWEAYVLRFDFEEIEKSCQEHETVDRSAGYSFVPTVEDFLENNKSAAATDFDLLMRYMAWGMASLGCSYTLAHHCDIDRSRPGCIRVTVQALGHPLNSRARKGLFGRPKKWWANALENLDSGWQLVWRFGQSLRELGSGAAHKKGSFMLRWRTLCKQICSRTLRRFGVPSSSGAYSDSIPGKFNFLFFEGTESLAAAKHQLLYNLRCRKVGFSRLPAHEAGTQEPDPYACDVHFRAGVGIPLAWLWGLNNHLKHVCDSSSEETSTRELKTDVTEEVTCDRPWPDMPSSSPLPRQKWPDVNCPLLEDLLTAAQNDTDENTRMSDSEPATSTESD